MARLETASNFARRLCAAMKIDACRVRRIDIRVRADQLVTVAIHRLLTEDEAAEIVDLMAGDPGQLCVTITDEVVGS